MWLVFVVVYCSDFDVSILFVGDINTDQTIIKHGPLKNIFTHYIPHKLMESRVAKLWKDTYYYLHTRVHPYLQDQ